MVEETKPDYVYTGLTFNGYPVLLGARKDLLAPRLADYLTLTRLDRELFKYCHNVYEMLCDRDNKRTIVNDAMSWPEGKGPRSISERAVERAKELIQACLAEEKANHKWYQFWK